MCLNPLTIKVSTPYLNKHIQIPCGKCIQCLKNYQNGWMVRMFYESTQHTKISFATLTYSPKHVPKVIDTLTGEVHLSLCKSHFQLALKRFRRHIDYYNKSLKFKYFVCGEYGPT